MEFENVNIYLALRDQCLEHYRHDYNFDRWPSMYIEFVDKMDLGIKVKRNNNGNDVYEIVDEKKWLLTKLKYGL